MNKILLAIFLFPGTVWTWAEYMFPGRSYSQVWGSSRRWKSPAVKALYSLIIWGVLIMILAHKPTDQTAVSSAVSDNANVAPASEISAVPDDAANQTVNVIAPEDWPFVRSALGFAYSLGEQADIVRWANRQNGHKGTVLLIGPGNAECRQFRISQSLSDDNNFTSEKISYCQDGTIQ